MHRELLQLSDNRRFPFAGIIPDQVEGPPHTTVVLSARLHRDPLADDK